MRVNFEQFGALERLKIAVSVLLGWSVEFWPTLGNSRVKFIDSKPEAGK